MHLEKHCQNPILVMKRQSGAANVEFLVTKTMDFFLLYKYKKIAYKGYSFQMSEGQKNRVM